MAKGEYFDVLTVYTHDGRHCSLTKHDVLALQLSTLSTDIEQRPSARALHVAASISKLNIEGVADDKVQRPRLVEQQSAGTTAKPLIQAVFDTNPLNGSFLLIQQKIVRAGAYDFFVQLLAQPLFIVYHAATINTLADVFTPPESVRLNQLTAAAMSKYEEVKERSTTGMAHALERRTTLVLDVHLEPTTLLVPQMGVFTE
jgi:vacuolar protein sorting-associated protein 13A/C